MQAHPSAVCNPVSHQCSGVANMEGETLDKVEEAIAGMVARKRVKVLHECSVKIGGDTGKGFLKVTASIFNPGTSFQDESEKNVRRTRN